MKLRIDGQGAISLGQADFVGSGGEGSVYAKGSTAIKVYHDPSRMIPVGKLGELAAITDPDVIKPERIVRDRAGRAVGYTMRFLSGTHALCQLFPPAFRQRTGITPDTTLRLVQSLRQRVDSAHRAGVLVVDLNELNFVVDAGFCTVYAIDVDSYQTAHYPATAIMPSVRDPQVQGRPFTELSDWFSFAVVSFNLFVGIHPYRGQHPTLKSLEDRMRAGVSVFHPDVSVPRVVLGFDVIPEVYRQWYRAVLQEGQRLPPPSDLHAAVAVVPRVRHLAGTDRFDIREVHAYPAAVLGFFDHDGVTLTTTTDGLFIGSRRVHDTRSGAAAVGLCRRHRRAVVAGTRDRMLWLFDPEAGEELPIRLRADAVTSYRGTIYVQSRDAVLEIVLTDLGDRLVATTRPAGHCLEHATHLFPGVLVQDLLGATWISLHPEPGRTHPLAVPELDDYRILEARFDGGVLMVLGTRRKGGRTDRLVLRFDGSFARYDVRKVEDVTPAALNFVTLDSGVCVCLDERDRLELTSARPGSAEVRVIEDPVLGGDMTLTHLGGRVGFVRGASVYAMEMR